MKRFEIDPVTLWDDIELLALERRQRRRGRLPPAQLKRIRHRARQRAKAKRIEAMRRREAARPRGTWRQVPFPHRVCDRMCAAMVPGEWYGVLDIARLIGGGRPERWQVARVLWRRGLVERAQNPQWAGLQSPQAIAARGGAEPQWLYRLTADGVAHGAAVRLALDVVDGTPSSGTP